jgi:hypothetical protein
MAKSSLPIMADFTVLLTDVTFFAYFLSCRIVMKEDE